jgi:membrane fusion protein, copper/silver efflux system
VGASGMRTTSAVCSVLVCTLVFSLSPAGGLAAAAAQSQAVAKYHCPMHPSYVSDHMGDCPVCGMKLTPVKGAESAARPDAAPAAATAAPIAVSAEKQRVLGLAVTPVQRAAGERSLRALGKVAPDEARVYRVNAGAPGSMRTVSPVVTGDHVKKEQVLGSFYAPDTVSVTQLFVLNTQGYTRKAVGNIHEQPKGEKGEDDADVGHNNSSIYNANLQQRIMQLENFGISAHQREQIMREHKVPDAIEVVAPASGVVLARNVSVGQKFDRGFELYRIADLSKVWVIADVFPQDARHVRPGMRAQVSVPGDDVTLTAKVAEILPQFDAATRTLKVKLVVDNAGLVLRPDMFVDVALSAELPAALVVPSDAVVQTGLAKRVFVQTAPGVFEARTVQTGWRSGDQVQITKGLAEGELVVSSGTFFLDSETRMRPTNSGAALAPAPPGSRARGGAGAVTEARADQGHHGHGDER